MKAGELFMGEKIKKGFDFRALGIFLGILIVVIPITWMAIKSLLKDDKKTGEDISWIG